MNGKYIYSTGNDTVFIIGNGFDLNLGLKTSYTDFINSDHFINIYDKNELAKHLKAKKELQNWVDIELELAIYSKRNAGSIMSKQEVKEDYTEVKCAMRDYLKTIDLSSHSDKSFVNYFIKELCKNIVEDKHSSRAVNMMNIDVVCFNYTSTIESLNIPLNNARYFFPHTEYCHGNLDGNDIVFGVEDQAEIKKEHVFLKKSTQLERTIGDNRNIDLYRILKPKTNIFFIGHSLGVSDKTYFSRFFKDCTEQGGIKGKNIFFTYHNEAAKDSLYSEIDVLTGNKLTDLQNNNQIKFINVMDANFEFKNHQYTYKQDSL